MFLFLFSTNRMKKSSVSGHARLPNAISNFQALFNGRIFGPALMAIFRSPISRRVCSRLQRTKTTNMTPSFTMNERNAESCTKKTIFSNFIFFTHKKKEKNKHTSLLDGAFSVLISNYPLVYFGSFGFIDEQFLKRRKICFGVRSFYGPVENPEWKTQGTRF